MAGLCVLNCCRSARLFDRGQSSASRTQAEQSMSTKGSHSWTDSAVVTGIHRLHFVSTTMYHPGEHTDIGHSLGMMPCVNVNETDVKDIFKKKKQINHWSGSCQTCPLVMWRQFWCKSGICFAFCFREEVPPLNYVSKQLTNTPYTLMSTPLSSFRRLWANNPFHRRDISSLNFSGSSYCVIYI